MGYRCLFLLYNCQCLQGDGVDMRSGHYSSMLLMLQRYVLILSMMAMNATRFPQQKTSHPRTPQSHPLDLLLGLSLLLLARRPLLSGHPRPAL